MGYIENEAYRLVFRNRNLLKRFAAVPPASDLKTAETIISAAAENAMASKAKPVAENSAGGVELRQPPIRYG